MSDQVISENFTFTDISTEDVKIVDVKAYGDDRGYFMETYKRPDFIAGGIELTPIRFEKFESYAWS